MKERPILFSGPMVRAILDGKKTQTRRIIKPQPPVNHNWIGWLLDTTVDIKDIGKAVWGRGEIPLEVERTAIRCPYGQVGDVLWVRETFITGWPIVDGEIDQFDEDGNELPVHIWYRADAVPNDGWVSNLGAKMSMWTDDDGFFKESIPWKPSIHMPRWTSRLSLRITGVRVERLQDISEEEARAEGVSPFPLWLSDDGSNTVETYRKGFEVLWDTIYAPRGYGWDTNPWVWIVSFERLTPEKGNYR